MHYLFFPMFSESTFSVIELMHYLFFPMFSESTFSVIEIDALSLFPNVFRFHFFCYWNWCIISFSQHVFKINLSLSLSQTSPGFYVSAVQVFWKHCGKRRNCSYRAISPFHTVFSTCLKNFLSFSSNMKLSSANSFSLEESKVCCLGKG